MNFLHSFLPQPDEIFQILLILMVVIWSTGRLFHHLKLPAVLGEILAGILVGPAVLGLVPVDSEAVKVLSELGVFFLMFHAGLDTDPREIFPRLKSSILTAIGGMIPIFAGVLAIAHFTAIPTISALFLAMVLSINSIPVILSMLKSFHLHDTKIGHTVIGSSVANEIILFVVLSVLLSVAYVGSLQPLLY
jgi:Kef-type K+ transport system membrane component KefB